MTTAESMALAVLKGGLVAARALADLLMQEYSEGAKEMLPFKKLPFDVGRARVIVYLDGDTRLDERDALPPEQAVADWLAGIGPLILCGIDRVEVYEIEPAP